MRAASTAEVARWTANDSDISTNIAPAPAGTESPVVTTASVAVVIARARPEPMANITPWV